MRRRVILPRKGGEKVEVSCEVCGKKELKTPSAARRHKTCSLKCRGRRSSILYYRQVTKHCEICGEPFEVKPSHYNERYTCSERCKYIRLNHHLSTLSGKGEKSVNWKGGRFLTPAGYVLVYDPENPMSNIRGYVREHRLVMSEKIGRPLTEDEVIHHIDGNKANNDIQNLQLMTPETHTSLHAKERRYARDASGRILKRVK